MTYTKRSIKSTAAALIFLTMLFIVCISSSIQGASLNDNNQVDTKYNIAPDKVWKINFNKEIDLNSINNDNVKVYDKITGGTISINIIKDYKDYKSFKIDSYTDYTKGKGYRIEIINVKTKDNSKTLKPTKMDFYVKNIYSGLPGENGLIIIEDKAYATEYLLTHSKEVNEIILNKGYDVYFTNDVNYEQLSSILKYGFLYGNTVSRNYDKMTYIDSQGKNHLYIWDKENQEYKLYPATVDLKIVVRSDVKLISVTPSNLVSVPGARYYKLKHSSSISDFEKAMIYTTNDKMEEISILSSDKTVLAKGYFSIQANMIIKCYLDTVDGYGSGNTSGNINNNGIVALDSNGFIYYSNSWDKEKLYKMGFDGVFNKKISEDKAQYINITQDYIYYSNYSNGGKLYRSELDGSKSQLLVDDKAAYITLSGDYIYYSNHSDGGKLYKVKKDGSDAIKNHGNPVANASTGEVAYISIDGEWIYYINHLDGHKPYVINKDGTYKGKLSDEYATSLQVYGDSVYYCSGGGVISKVKKDGTGGIVRIKGTASEINKGFHINVFDEWLYYSNSEDKNKLYKIKTNGSGEKIKLSEDSVGYINIVSGYIYYNTTNGKLFRIDLNGNTATKPEEVGGKPVIENILDINNLRAVVSFQDVNEDIKFLEKKYLPEKVAAIMGDNIMKQLVVIWDTTKVTVKDGIRTYKGNAVGYNKTITFDLVLPSEMLNDTNEINIYNNNGKNDTVEVVAIQTDISNTARRIQEGEIIRVYSDEECKYKLGEGKVTREKKVLIQKLDLDAFGKSIWITITRIGKAESAPTEVKQVEAPIIQLDAARDKDYANLGLDIRDFSIGQWKPSAKNPYVNTIAPTQSIYIVPSKVVLDMKSFQAKEELISIATNSWDGAKLYNDLTGDKLELRKLDSKKTLFKAQNYDVYIATKYSGEGGPDSDGKRPRVNGMISSDTPSIMLAKEEALPKKPIIITQRVRTRERDVDKDGIAIGTAIGTEITLAIAPAIGETAWIVPVEDIAKVKGWKWEDRDKWLGSTGWVNEGGNNPYDPFKELEKEYAKYGTQLENITKLVGDGSNKFIKAPLGMKDDAKYKDKNYKLFIVNGVGASVEGGASLRDTNDSIIVDNQASTLSLLSKIVVKAGDFIKVKTSENPNMPLESERARVFIIDGDSDVYTLEQLENSVKNKNGKFINVRNKDVYKLYTTGLEAKESNFKKPNYTIVVVDDAGNVSPLYRVSIVVKTYELKELFVEVTNKLGITNTEDKATISRMNSLISYLPNVKKIIENASYESQNNITDAFNNLKSKYSSFLNLLDPKPAIITKDIDVSEPMFTYKDPAEVDSSSIKVNIKSDKAATAHYVVLPADFQCPDYKLLMHSNSLGMIKSTIPLLKNTEKPLEIDITSLKSKTDYIIYVVLEDDDLNYSDVEKIEFTTK
ncbi:DUF5050 domain-containing protein [Clostridium sp. CS001]|uniref:DUF5050 domain-containing protein n=1 Tax=Clostridium sp. CS001 TaxID=2880648 RepID=UPI001CF3F2DD|nr:DUF5050 domain-containing protein [Clostridium sp. CS001]MCB2288866.1 DUF5050 domain-containing protein [Clostridium sp. CS001]